jgi:hypothetical protein
VIFGHEFGHELMPHGASHERFRACGCRRSKRKPAGHAQGRPLRIKRLFKRSPHQPRPEIAFLRLIAGGRVALLDAHIGRLRPDG